MHQCPPHQVAHHGDVFLQIYGNVKKASLQLEIRCFRDHSCVTYNYMIWLHIHKIGNVLYMPPSSGDTSVLQITCVLNVCHIWYDG